MKKLLIHLILILGLLGLGLTACSDDDDSSSDKDTADTTDTNDTDDPADTNEPADSDSSDAGDTASDMTDTADTDDTAAYKITANISVPAEYDATAVSLLVAFHDSYPPASPMPAAVGESFQGITIGVDTPYALETSMPAARMDTTPTDGGEYYLSVVLYVEGGGTMMPVANVDYVGGSDIAIAAPLTADIDLGDIDLSLLTE